MTSGEIAPVEGTPMDFRTPKTIGRDINADDVQLHNANGYDHNWVLDTKGDITACAATLENTGNGIRMEVYTDEPGVQVYTGNFLDGTVTGKGGLSQARCYLPRDPALSRQPQQTQLAFGSAPSRRDLHRPLHLQIHCSARSSRITATNP